MSILALGAAGLIYKDSILERWYLHALEVSDEVADQKQILERLVKSGYESALLELMERGLKCSSFPFLRGLPGVFGGIPKFDAFDRKGTPEISFTYADAIGEIASRLGKERSQAACWKYMMDPARDSRARVYLARFTILSTKAVDEYPAVPMSFSILDPPPRESEEFVRIARARPAAINVCAQALSNKDRATRGLAAFALSMCGQEANQAVDALKGALQDSHDVVRHFAAEALKNIGRDEHLPPP